MTPSNFERLLSLVVENPQALQHGSQPRHSFGSDGGTIGSQGADWELHDLSRSVHRQHCEIRHEDGGFLVIDRCGETLVNDQMQPLGPNASARLRHGDKLRIGPFWIGVHLDNDFHSLPDPARSLAEHDLGEFLHVPTHYVDSTRDDTPYDIEGECRQRPGWAEFQSLAEPLSPKGLLDPLEALDAVRNLTQSTDSNSPAIDPHHYGHTLLAAQADASTTPFEAIYGSPTPDTGACPMLEQEIQTPASREWLQRQLSDGADPASLVEPLLEGLGAPLGSVDGAEVHALLHEAGRTLGALIRGLSALNVPLPGEQQRISLAGRTLQPIEDNPLRLGQNYQETVRALFSAQRSAVHLSPSAAVEESLEHIHRQQVAVYKAITAGLGALLQAFSPEQLQQRFQRYRNGQTGQPPADDWAWRMYEHYYGELTSGRQQGFDKLFWEVFEPAFDQALRAEVG
ncbi:type VI secretion system-associated FHA domain protein TagH [Pseudomonas plecoglossicida]|uniref:Type VI secretion system-associated FHA domain protein TagH n=1 Tax=Pseudomonas plecoglossicida TaxID=70775 RepID=A0AAD0R6N2_PSEDL|nr:type VI secretion system-associated FHA domain protein TagH [Pseudomonas plecoglossicida]AXM98851.1 type VI secretion system-associated FHA domain protein TagH [Pseudomonas plecoglossicida]EPB95216.1 FHA domain-containing protein [Pseudomonas plecoglossicida NB2011]QLB54998.1 type VI secretion system-associated FHA domain protein TagH [Pseudomonas plecoglossicida]GLR35396.1 phosphopeptide-binding protein [Pseudomonas plecoglossicida]